jgi:hypothetical protein
MKLPGVNNLALTADHGGFSAPFNGIYGMIQTRARKRNGFYSS